MYEDDTIRLFGVADLLKNKKNNSNNWERDDIPDVKPQALTGKYDHNFDAPGSDFVRAHQYNFHNTDQPENTKTDVKYDDKYTKFFNYTPSKYVQLEEEEYKPIGKYNEKADEYYIDHLEGKTLNDMVVSKMKENAGADDLDPRAARERFAENLAAEKLQSALEEDDRLGGNRLDMFGNMEEQGAQEVVAMAPRRGRKKKAVDPTVPQIEPAQLSSSTKGGKNTSIRFSEGYRSDDEGGGGAKNVTLRTKKSKQKALIKQQESEVEEKEQKYRATQEKRAERLQLKKGEEEDIKKEKLAKKKQTLANVFGALKQNVENEKQETENAKTQHENRLQNKVLKQLQSNKEKQHNSKVKLYDAKAHHSNQSQKKALTQLSKGVQQKQLQNVGNTHHKEKSLKKAFAALRSNKKDEWENVEFEGPKVEKSTKKATKSPATDVTELADYMGSDGGGSAYVPRGQHPNTSLALQKVAQGKLESKHPVVLQYKKSFENIADDVLVDKGTQRSYNKDVQPKVTIKLTDSLTVGEFKKLIAEEAKRREPNLKLTTEVLDNFNSPPKKGKKTVESGSLSPLQSIQGMISHNNPPGKN